MTVSRRKFLFNSLKLVAVTAAAPVALKISAATAVRETVAAPVPKAVSRCSDFSPQITIQEYVPGARIKYQELKTDGTCEMCKYESRCTAKGNGFVQISNVDVPEYWSRKLQRKWYEQS